MESEEFKNEELFRDIVMFLDNHTLVQLQTLIDMAVDERLKMVGRGRIIGNPFVVNNPKVSEMESNCGVVYNLLGRDDLNHKERSVLLFIYAKLGNEGIKRLKDIMKVQKNYKQNITKQQIDAYLNKGKMYGISCDKIQELIGSQYCKECKYAKSN